MDLLWLQELDGENMLKKAGKQAIFVDTENFISIFLKYIEV